jgi:hypothetical protein
MWNTIGSPEAGKVNHSMKNNIRLIVSALFISVSLTFLLWGFLPSRRETVSTPLAIPAGMPALSEARTIHFTYSPVTRLGDSQVVELNLSAEGGLDGANVYEETNVIVEARLEFEGADARPADLVSAALDEGGAPTFYWEVTQREVGEARGTVWLYLRFVPKAGGEETRGPVSAQLVAIRSKSMLGRTGSEARVLGVVGCLVGLGILVLRRRAK